MQQSANVNVATVADAYSTIREQLSNTTNVPPELVSHLDAMYYTHSHVS